MKGHRHDSPNTESRTKPWLSLLPWKQKQPMVEQCIHNKTDQKKTGKQTKKKKEVKHGAHNSTICAILLPCVESGNHLKLEQNVERIGLNRY